VALGFSVRPRLYLFGFEAFHHLQEFLVSQHAGILRIARGQKDLAKLRLINAMVPRLSLVGVLACDPQTLHRLTLEIEFDDHGRLIADDRTVVSRVD